jgi:DNA-binding NarL/FixJ family response regulator
MKAIRVVLVDDHPLVLAGVKAVLLASDDIIVVGEASSGGAALALIADTVPDIAVIDISLADISGIEIATRLVQAGSPVRVLALSVHEDRAYVQQLMGIGAKGYLLKRSAAEDLARAIRAIAGGGTYLDPAIAAKAVSYGQVAERPAADGERLSPRETDVLRLIARGHSNKEIAGRLSISIKTVETYKARAAGKLALHTRADIVRHAAAQGWLEEIGDS